MTVKEYYERVSGNYDEAIKRFLDEERIKKYLRKFPESDSFDELCAAMEEKKYNEAFEAVHSMKGITANMALTEIYELTKLLTEELRGGKSSDKAIEYFEEFKVKYQNAIELIKEI